MKLSAKKAKVSDLNTDLLVLVLAAEDLKARRGVNKSNALSGVLSLDDISRALDKPLLKELKAEGFEGKAGQISLIKFPGEKKCKALLILGWDKKAKTEFDGIQNYRTLGSLLCQTAVKFNKKRVSLSSYGLDLMNKTYLTAFLEGTELARYKFDKYKSEKTPKNPGLSELEILSGRSLPAGVYKQARVMSEATCFARDLVNMPAADCTPAYMVRRARELARKGGLKLQVFDKKRLEKMGAKSLLSVAEGSSEAPYLIKLVYKPRKRNAKVISLVGKGVTFDSGGLSLKPPTAMEDMKIDMAGAAAVLGAMKAIAALKPEVEVRGYVPVTENMVNGKATRPGDIVKALNKKTIEILNTDAEGRLILADAITLAERDGCNVIIDLATLTGACMVALGEDYAAVFSTDDKLSHKIVENGKLAGERYWPMPLAEEYREQIKSPVADIKNIGGKWGGAITAALFLSEFVKKTPWAHIDIAGPAASTKAKAHIAKGGVGFGVRTLVRYIVSI